MESLEGNAVNGEPDIDANWSVLLDDPLFAVIAKSGNMPCHPGGRYRENTLESLLRKAGWGEVHFVSRLDRETSGAVVVAKNETAAARLGRDMAARRFDKHYLCLVEGIWKEAPGADGWFDAFGWIRPASDDVVRKYRVFERAHDLEAWRSSRSSESALTKFRPLWIGNGRTLLECNPETGRTAQIRATLHALGYPVVGDKLYGKDRRLYAKMCEDALTAEDLEELGMPRQALHSWKVGFPHPVTREWIAVEAPPPVDCRVFSLARKVPNQFVCQRCGACCRIPNGIVRVSDTEIARIAAFLGMTEEEFIERETEIAPDRNGLILKSCPDGACAWLTDDNLCRINPVKPDKCRTFPGEWRNSDSETVCPVLKELPNDQKTQEG